MKNLIILLLLITSCSTTKKINTEKTAKGIPVMAFENTFYDLGKMKQGETRDLEYKFWNRGDVDLVIEIATTCHCTQLDYPTTPIAPGQSGIIKAHFDSKEKDREELIDITIILANENPENGYPIVEEVKFRFDIE